MDAQTIIGTVVEQAKRQEAWRVQKLIVELRRRIDNNLPIPAAGQAIDVETAEAVIAAITPYAQAAR